MFFVPPFQFLLNFSVESLTPAPTFQIYEYTIYTTLAFSVNARLAYMAYDDINKYMDAAGEIGRNPVMRKHQIQGGCVK